MMSSIEVPIGMITPWMGENPDKLPDGWLLCDGAKVNTAQYPNYNHDFGTVYTPNLAGRVIVGQGLYEQGNYSRDYPHMEKGGAHKNTLKEDQMPSHQHFGWGRDNGGLGEQTGVSMAAKYKGAEGGDNNNYLFGSTFAGGEIGSDDSPVSTSNKSSNSWKRANSIRAINNMQPYLVLNYIIYVGPSEK